MRRGVLVGVLSAVVAFTGVIAPSSAGAVEPTRIENLVVDAGPFAVDGLTGSATARIAVDLTSGTPLWDSCEGLGGYEPGTKAVLTRLSGGPAETVSVDLLRVSGDGYAGSWAGEWRIGSTRGGVWTVTRVQWCNGEWTGVDPRVDPGITRTITVVGTNAPKLTLVRRIPSVVRDDEPQDFLYAFTDAAGRPLAGRSVALSGYDGSYYYRTTSSTGQLLVRVAGPYAEQWRLIHLATPAGPVTDESTMLATRFAERRVRFDRVSAVPAANVIPRGGSVVVTGSVSEGAWWLSPRVTVTLLRKDGSRWTAVSTAYLRASSRYTLRAPGTSAAAGRHEYRVVASHPFRVPTTSRTFVLTGR